MYRVTTEPMSPPVRTSRTGVPDIGFSGFKEMLSNAMNTRDGGDEFPEFADRTESPTQKPDKAKPESKPSDATKKSEKNPTLKAEQAAENQMLIDPAAQDPQTTTAEGISEPVEAVPAMSPQIPLTMTAQTDPASNPSAQNPWSVQAQAAQPLWEPESVQPVIPDEPATADIVSVQAVTEPEPGADVEIPQDMTAQAKFDNMLAKAAQELQGAVEPHQESIQAVLPQEQPVEEIEIPQAQAEPETEEPAIPAGTARETIPLTKPEQRPLREMPETDETLLEILQQRVPERMAAEPTRTEPTQPEARTAGLPEQAEQIHAEVARNLENLDKQRTEFRMQLKPAELGEVNVRMILEGGKLSVEITAANLRSAQMLSKQAEGLAASLRTGSIDLASVNVVAAAENAGGNLQSELGRFSQPDFQERQSSQSFSEHSRQRGESPAANGGESSPERDVQAPKRLLNYAI